ncbi:PREDICTED: uncharacterized protein LOC104814533 [Tarenaya hassleriana]|uniref:uncharacterized protein LOC104814533 n=1 Tax=Tarenaya hassleriana TaxID=28532 RepID=UPI00053C9E88|nr:PREDICTED: uncharacterized protein LOC104814533 [Tarenaya hassleriana]
MEDEEEYSSSESSGNGISLNGRNVGATMVAPREVSLATPSGCRINIYVNSNVQGACTSALFGSKVKLRDPGVHLYVGDLKVSGDGDGGGEVSRRQEMTWIKVGLCLVFLVNMIIAIVLLLSSWSR